MHSAAPLSLHALTGSHASVPAASMSFDFQPRTRLVYGPGTFSQLGSLIQELGGRRVLLVTDPGLRGAGHCDGAVSSVRAAGLQIDVFDAVSPNPTTDDVDRCVNFASAHQSDFLVGLGGGSSMDCAKGANFLLTNGGKMQDYRGSGRTRRPMLPMIAVPTTSGTGSEAQSFAVIADAATHMKMACGDPGAAFKVAILDPELTVTMPHAVAAATGIDAMTHAIESFVTLKRNPISQMYAKQAWQLLAGAFPVVLKEPHNVAARGQMQLGAFLAGAAIECSMLGAAHAASNPLTAHFGTVHGIAVGIMMPHVIRWNVTIVGELYRELAVAVGWCPADEDSRSAGELLAAGFTEFLRQADLPVSISQTIDQTLDDTLINVLAAEAAQQWTGTFNPCKMNSEGFAELYRRAFGMVRS